MKEGSYTIKEYFNNKNFEQIIIPEIQRDYVWNIDNVSKFLDSIEQDCKQEKQLQKVNESAFNNLPSDVREIVFKALNENKISTNIGFIYAYSDPEFVDKTFLIDGQQRLTTIFLILLSLSVKEKDTFEFRKRYFNENISKVDYKVREGSHNFIIKFINYILEFNDIESIENEYWYFDEYKYDATIKSLIKNFKYISSYLATSNIDSDFLLNNVDVWFFDTQKSEQGEELYLYMNSRGETVQPNENIKAKLLEGLSSTEKNSWGLKWETWQDFFWKHSNNFNVDEGFNEFLKWIKIIEIIRNSEINQNQLVSKIIALRNSKDITEDLITLEKIERYFNSLQYIYLSSDYKYKESDWVRGRTSIIDYVKLLPALLYKSERDNEIIDLIRYSRYFNNIIRLTNFYKSPYIALIQSIIITIEFLNKGYNDVADLLKCNENNIITDEEKFKLTLYKENELRCEIEKEFWKAEDFILLNGEVKFIFDCMGIDMKIQNANFDVKIFSRFSAILSNYFSKPSDLLYRAILTKGDYTTWEGNTPTLNANRYTFKISDSTNVLKLNKSHIIIKFIKDIFTRQGIKNDILEEIINEYLNEKTKDEWVDNFIKYPEILEYMNEKKIAYDDSNNLTYLLKRTKATQFQGLNDFKKEHKLA